MARTNSTDSIPPFPPDLDRQHFGHWLSGLTDGEGSFHLGTLTHRRKGRQTPAAAFTIGLRADDLPILRLIQSFFRCGFIRYVSREDQRRRGKKVNDCAYWRVTRTLDLIAVIIPHFEAFPLRAKKVRDFRVWKDGIYLMHQCSRAPRVRVGPTNGQIWTPDRLRHFRSLADALKAGRQYQAPPIDLPKPPPPPPEPGLFD